MFCKTVVFRNFTKFTGKHLYQSLFLIKLQASPKNTILHRTPLAAAPVNESKIVIKENFNYFLKKTKWFVNLLFMSKISCSKNITCKTYQASNDKLQARTIGHIFWKSVIETKYWPHRRHSGVFIVLLPQITLKLWSNTL